MAKAKAKFAFFLQWCWTLYSERLEGIVILKYLCKGCASFIFRPLHPSFDPVENRGSSVVGTKYKQGKE
jgi:hypothetical protein